MKKANEKIRKYALMNDVSLDEVAMAMDRSYDWIIRKLRRECGEAETQEFMRVIDEIASEPDRH